MGPQKSVFSGYRRVPQSAHQVQASGRLPNNSSNNADGYVGDGNKGYGPASRQSTSGRTRPYEQ